MSSDSESFGFGGATMGGHAVMNEATTTTTASHGLNSSFGLANPTVTTRNDDPFSGLSSSMSHHHHQSAISSSSSTTSSSPPPPSLPVTSLSSSGIAIGTTYGEQLGAGDDNDHDDSGFVMGGLAGTGLQPTAPPPPVPPPPPPAYY